MKKALFIGLLIPVAFGLSGCLSMTKKSTKKVSTKKSSKKLASRSSGSGVPLARYKPGDKRFWDDRVEAFVLEGDEQDQRYAPKVSHNDSSRQEKREWKEEKAERDSFETVYFSYGEYTIRKDQEAVVQYDTEQAKEAVKGGKIVRVEGHSDRKCISETYNMAVSQKRANTVSKRLASSGVSQDSIKAIGYGDSQVAVDVEGREQKNRRVEFATLVS